MSVSWQVWTTEHFIAKRQVAERPTHPKPPNIFEIFNLGPVHFYASVSFENAYISTSLGLSFTLTRRVFSSKAHLFENALERG